MHLPSEFLMHTNFVNKLSCFNFVLLKDRQNDSRLPVLVVFHPGIGTLSPFGKKNSTCLPLVVLQKL